ALFFISGYRNTALGELGFVDGEAETRRGRQLKEAIDRDRGVVEDGVRARRRVVPFAGLCRVQLARCDMQARHVADRRLCLIRPELDPMRQRQRGAANMPVMPPIFTMSGCSMRTPAAIRSASPVSV